MKKIKPHLRICTPSYDGRVTVGYLEAVMDLYTSPDHHTGINFVLGDSLVTRARNHLISNFYEDNKNNEESFQSHLLWLDSDVSIDKKSLWSMIQRDVDVVAAPVPLKVPPTKFGEIQTILNVYEEVEEYFYKARYASTAVFLMSFNAVDKVIQHCIKNNRVYVNEGQTIYDVFGVGIKDNVYLSEDYFLCNMLNELGIEIYIDSNTTVLHIDTPRLAWRRDPMLLNKEKNDLNKGWLTNEE